MNFPVFYVQNYWFEDVILKMLGCRANRIRPNQMTWAMRFALRLKKKDLGKNTSYLIIKNQRHLRAVSSGGLDGKGDRRRTFGM